jgi:hypothetical protein
MLQGVHRLRARAPRRRDQVEWVESEDDTDSFVLTPGSSNPRRWSFGATPDGKSEPFPTRSRTFSCGSREDIQKLKEYLEEYDHQYEHNELRATLGKLEAATKALEKGTAEDRKQAHDVGELAADLADVLELEIQQHVLGVNISSKMSPSDSRFLDTLKSTPPSQYLPRSRQGNSTVTYLQVSK